MVPAAEVTWLDAHLTAAEALERALETAHTRFPVARGSLDRVVGMIHLRDLLEAVPGTRPERIDGLARAPFIVPETKDLGALLHEMRRRREHLAIVLDEYGHTAGIVTMEDILEEIVGEIEDEYGLPVAALRRLDGGIVEVAGSMTIDDFNETLGTHLPQPGVRTLAGLVFDRLGRLPAVGDSATIDDVQLRVHATEGPRITALRITVPKQEARADAGE
jgi:putative hemolysin